MTNTILILHGIEGYPGIHWQQWLYDEVKKLKLNVYMPSLPNPNKPKRKAWFRTIKQVVGQFNLKNLVIVAHSLGVTSSLDFIESIPTPIKALISVSGFAHDYGAKLNSYFLKEKSIDFKKIKKNVKEIYVFYGNNDPYVPQKTLKALADSLGVKAQVFLNGGHLNTSAGYTKFPEILKLLKRWK